MASWDYNPYNWSYNPTSNLYLVGVPLCRGVPTPCSSTQKNTKKDPRTKLLLVEEVGDIAFSSPPHATKKRPRDTVRDYEGTNRCYFAPYSPK